jgi:hypothetical protein
MNHFRREHIKKVVHHCWWTVHEEQAKRGEEEACKQSFAGRIFVIGFSGADVGRDDALSIPRPFLIPLEHSLSMRYH